jgi:cell division protein FtsQ
VQKITGRGQSAGLLEPEQAGDVSRPKMYAETAYIPDPVLDETANTEASEPFLRARQRVPVRRRGGSRFLSQFGWKSRWVRVAAVLIAVAVLGLMAAAFWATKSLLLHDPHFVLASAKNIQVTGNRVVPNSQVLAFFALDSGRSIFRVPLAGRQAELEQIRWVRRATVMRLWPNRLRVSVLERTPIAFARDGDAIRLVDDDGVLLDMPNAAAQHYSFPVLTGISSSDQLSTRAARIDIYRQFVQALDAEGGHISGTLSQADLSDPEDVRAMFTGAAAQPLVHFGASDFLPRYRAYRAHLTEWLQQYPQLRSVDMRYGRQVVLDTGTGGQTPAVTSQAIPSAAIPFDDTETPAPAASAPENSAPVHKAAAAHAVSAHKSIRAKSRTRTAASKRSGTAKHRATSHRKIHKHVPPSVTKRGHTVRKPIMHVVTGA